MTPKEQVAFFEEQRVKRLFRKYRIDPTSGDRWRDLALALAKRHEPHFSPLKRGRPKKHDDDPELILRVELLRCRDGLSITNACKVISETGALKGKPTTLQDRYKRLMHHPRHDWCTLLKVLRAMARDRDTYIEGLEAGSGAKIFNFTPTV
jgi:hypothetical protein